MLGRGAVGIRVPRRYAWSPWRRRCCGGSLARRRPEVHARPSAPPRIYRPIAPCDCAPRHFRRQWGSSDFRAPMFTRIRVRISRKLHVLAGREVAIFSRVANYRDCGSFRTSKVRGDFQFWRVHEFPQTCRELPRLPQFLCNSDFFAQPGFHRSAACRATSASLPELEEAPLRPRKRAAANC